MFLGAIVSLAPISHFSIASDCISFRGKWGTRPGTGRRTRDMIHAGLAEYVALLSGIGGGTLTKFEPTMTVIAIVACLLFLFWLVVFKL